LHTVNNMWATFYKLAFVGLTKP